MLSFDTIGDGVCDNTDRYPDNAAEWADNDFDFIGDDNSDTGLMTMTVTMMSLIYFLWMPVNGLIQIMTVSVTNSDP